ncbi:MAG: hypothetical protein IPJ23_00275 [Ignavibacteriales bacterium]|nr:hypothetical protein [Ignavibacteriales bacterium]
MRRFVIIIFSILFLTSCGGYKTGVLEKESSGYIKFIGNTLNASVEIGESINFSINPETNLYKLNPGKYTVRVYRDNNLVVERILIIQSQNTIELEVP